jgi:hypothetical protein
LQVVDDESVKTWEHDGWKEQELFQEHCCCYYYYSNALLWTRQAMPCTGAIQTWNSCERQYIWKQLTRGYDSKWDHSYFHPTRTIWHFALLDRLEAIFVLECHRNKLFGILDQASVWQGGCTMRNIKP